MFWIALALVGLSLLMLKLGALSVWVKVLGSALAAMGAIFTLGLGVLLYRQLVIHRRADGGTRLARASIDRAVDR